MQPAQQPRSKPFESGHWTMLGAVLGAFLGLLFGKSALGLIFGFFGGILTAHKSTRG